MSRFIGDLDSYDRELSDLTLLRRYVEFIAPHKIYLFITIIAIILGSAFSLLVPFSLRSGVDSLVAGQTEAVFLAAAAYLVFTLGRWIANAFQKYYNTKFTALSTHDIRADLFKRVQEHDMAFFDSNKTAKILTRIMDDTTVIAEFVTLAGQIVTALLTAVGTVVVLFIFNIKMTLLALSVVPLLIISIMLFRSIARRLARAWRTSVSELNDSFGENVAGISISKSFGRQDQSRDEFETLNQENFWVNFKKSAFLSSIFPIVFAISNIGLFLVLYYGGIDAVTTGAISPGDIVLYVAYLQQFYFPILLLTNFYNQLQSGLAAAERIFTLMDVTSKVDKTGTDKLVPKEVEGKLQFDDVTFSYDGKVNVFDHFNLTINPGETVALVGHTGAGKSSIISLLIRFYELTDGNILLDGKDIKNYTLESYRSAIGMVLQDPLLFSGTIRSNIAYGLDEATDEQILAAAKAANLLEFIESQPEGLDTQLQERGRRLSQGQKQLISLARAFIVDPRILVLDEATASIDAYSEALIQESIDTLLSDRTSLVIAHRLTTVKRADRIVVLDHGHIIEDGTHASLLEQNGHYASLYQKYFAFQEVDNTVQNAD